MWGLRITIIVGGVAAIVAAGLSLYASTIEVPDNIDTFIGELRRVGTILTWSAVVNITAAIANTIDGLLRR